MTILATVLLLAMLVAVLPSNQAAFHGNMGTYTSSASDKDFVSFLQGSGSGAFCFGYIEDSSNPNDPSKWAWMLHISTSDCSTPASPSAARTWLITAFGGGTQNKWLKSSDTTYVGADFDGLAEATTTADWLCYLESDGINGYSIGDVALIDHENFPGTTPSTTGTITANDLRLASVSSSQLTPFSASAGIVKTTDHDAKRAGEAGDSQDPSRLPTSTSLVCGDFEAKTLDLGSLSSMTSGDVYYLVHSDRPTDTVHPGMVRLTSVSGISGHAQKVASGNNDHKKLLEVLEAADLKLAIAKEGSADAEDWRLAIQQANHPAGDNSRVRMNDVYIKRNTGTSASSPGSLVTSGPSGTQIGARSSIDETHNLAPLIFFIDTAPTGVFDATDPVYIQHPDNDGETTLSVNDIRLAVPGKSSGSLVTSSDSDYTAHKDSTADKSFELKLFSARNDTRMPLKAVSDARWHDSDLGDSGIFDPDRDNIYLTTATTVEDGAIRVWHNTTDGSGTVDQEVTCPGDNDCGQTLTTGAKVKTTGPDGTFQTAGRDAGELLYWSDDNFVTIGDFRLGPGPAAHDGTVAADDADVDPGLRFPSSSSSEITLFASVHSGFEHPTAGDIQVFPSFGTRWTHSTSGAVARLSEITDYSIVRAELGDGGSPLGDVVYLDFSYDSGTPGEPCPFSAGRVLRMLPYDSNNAGSFVLTGDTIERQATKQCEADSPADFFGYIDNTPTGFDTSDFLYLDLPSDIGGSTGTTLSSWDIRITPVSHGSSSFVAGTQVKSGNSDLVSFGGDSLEGSGDAKILWWDADLNDVVDQSDALWLRLRTDTGLPVNVPTYLDVRLNGSPASSGGGGGTSPPSEPSTTPTASFTATMDGRDLSVDAAASSAISGRTLEDYAWDFGDDTTTDGSLATATHTYEEEGQFTVRLTVTDSQGETDTTTRTVQTDGYVPTTPPSDDDGDDDGTDDDGTTDDGATDDDGVTGDGEEEGSPAIGMILVLAALGTVLTVLRRRK